MVNEELKVEVVVAWECCKVQFLLQLHSFSQHFEGSVKVSQPSKKHAVTSPTTSTSSFLAKLSASKQVPTKLKRGKSTAYNNFFSGKGAFQGEK